MLESIIMSQTNLPLSLENYFPEQRVKQMPFPDKSATFLIETEVTTRLMENGCKKKRAFPLHHRPLYVLITF